jgi:hypothetical protein
MPTSLAPLMAPFLLSVSFTQGTIITGILMDIIFLGGLKVDTIIGIYDWEREIKQTVILDIEMAYDIKKAAAMSNCSREIALLCSSKLIFFKNRIEK